MALIDEWYVWVEGPAALSPAEAEQIRELVTNALDQCCRRAETELALRRGHADIRVQAI